MHRQLTLVYVLVFYIGFTATHYSQWIELTNAAGLPGQTGTAYAIDAIDSSSSVISIENGLYRTTDGGKSWKMILSNHGTPVIDVSMVAGNIWAALMNGQIKYSSDGGSTWKLQFSDIAKTNSLNYIEMFDAMNGIAMGDNVNSTGPAVLLNTTDGGTNWVSVNNESVGYASGDLWRRLDFVNKNTGFYFPLSATQPNTAIYKTTNGGRNWANVFNASSLSLIKFYDENIGVFAGYKNSVTTKIVRTYDGGKSWTETLIPNSGGGMDFEFIPGDPGKLWFTNGKKLFFSSDTGSTFSEYMLSSSTLFLQDIAFPNADCGWILGSNGMIFRTTSPFSKTTSVKIDLKQPEGFDLVQNYPNPFNPATTINYSLPEGGNIKLCIYDILGNEINTVVNEYKAAGRYSFQFDGSALPSGIYLYRIQCGKYTRSKKMTLLK